MLIIPAIDILQGKCVRLTQGNYNRSTIYEKSPVSMAEEFEKLGVKRLHVVDLDGARSGYPVNTETILEIAKVARVPVQVGGGIRRIENAANLLNRGIARIILGTTAIENPKIVENLVKSYGPSRIIVSLDYKNGNIAVEGWTQKSTKSIPGIIDFLKNVGIKTIIVTDTTKDGSMQGPNLSLAGDFIKEQFDVIVAGGISSPDDIRELQMLGAAGAIVGKALYEGKVNLKDLQKIAARPNHLTKRIIPCLDVKQGRVVKGTHFKNLRDAGDPVESGKMYSRAGADELVFLDIEATRENRPTLCGLVERIAGEIDIPFTIGGGIRDVRQIRDLLNAGADKISIGTAAVQNSALVREAAACFGSQCITISVDAKRNKAGWNICIKGGTVSTEIDAVEFSRAMEKAGAGELLVNCLDKDGTREGFDIELIKTIVKAVNIPVIASSGAGGMRDFLDVFQKADASAVLAASVFHYGETSISELKKYLKMNGIPIRLTGDIHKYTTQS